MLWRVGQGFRHLHQATSLLLVTPRVRVCPFLIVQPLHHSTVVQWPPAVNYLVHSSSPTSRVVHEEVKTGSASQSTAEALPLDPPCDLKRAEQSGSCPPTVPPREVLLGPLIDKFYFRPSLKRGTLQRLSKSGDAAHLLSLLSDRTQALKLATLMTDTGHPQRALRVLTLAQKFGCSFRQTMYEGVAHRLASLRQWRLLCSIVELARRQSGRTTIRLLNWRARALMELQDFALLDGVIDLFQEEGLKPSRRTYHIIISGHLRNRDLLRAKRYLADMENAGIPMDASTHAMIACSYRSFGSDPTVKAKALEILTKIDNRESTSVLNSLIQLSLDAHDMPGALRYLNMYGKSVPNSEHQGDDITLPEGNTSRPRADAATFTMLIEYLAKGGDLPRIMQVIQRMNAAGVLPDSRAVAALVRAHFVAGQPETAVHIAAAVCGELPSTRPLFEKISSLPPADFELPFLPARIVPTVHIFNALLQGVLKIHGLNGMRVIQHLMRLNGIPMDEYTLEIFLSYLDRIECARPSEIIRVLRRSRSVGLSLRHIHVIMRSILHREEGRPRRVGDQELVPPKTQEVSGVAASFDPTAGVEFTRWLSYRALARPLIRSLAARRVRSDRATFALRIKHDAVVKQNMEMAKQSLEAMVSRGLHPNEFHVSALMEGYAQSGDLNAAREIMQSAVKLGIQPNVQMYTILINGYARQRNPFEALRLFQDMGDAGITPDVVVVHALVSAFIATGNIWKARRLLLRIWPTVATFPADSQDAPLRQLMNILGSISRKDGARERLSEHAQRTLRYKVKRLAYEWTARLRRRRIRTRGTGLRVVPAIKSRSP